MSGKISAISQWIDTSKGYKGIDPEAHIWRRTMKVVSEAGEAHDALCGILGENPRKGVTHTQDDLLGELLDCALAALGAVEHLTGNQGKSMEMLEDKIDFVIDRAGIIGMECPKHERIHDAHGWYICLPNGGILDENGFHPKETLPVP